MQTLAREEMLQPIGVHSLWGCRCSNHEAGWTSEGAGGAPELVARRRSGCELRAARGAEACCGRRRGCPRTRGADCSPGCTRPASWPRGVLADPRRVTPAANGRGGGALDRRRAAQGPGLVVHRRGGVPCRDIDHLGVGPGYVLAVETKWTRMGSVGDRFRWRHTHRSWTYTVKVVPAKAYDALVYVPHAGLVTPLSRHPEQRQACASVRSDRGQPSRSEFGSA